jgi:hypothetical protein
MENKEIPANDPNPAPDAEEKIAPSLKANWPVNIPIFFAIAGLIYAIVVLDVNGCNSKAVYHDLYLENKVEMVDTVISRRIKRLKDKAVTILEKRLKDSLAKKGVKSNRETPAKPVTETKDKTTTVGLSTSNTSASKVDTIQLIETALAQSMKDLIDIRHHNTDTSLELFLKYFTINRDTLWRGLADEENQGCKFFSNGIRMIVNDTFSLSKNSFSFPRYDSAALIKVDSLFNQKKEKAEIVNIQIGRGSSGGLMKFFYRHPNFGFWFILALTQMTMWWMLIPILVGNVKATDHIVPKFRYNLGYGLLMSLIPIAIIGLFVWIVYFHLIDTFIIGDCYFLDGFINRMYWYSTPGYIVTIICFGIYLFLANKLQLLSSETREIALRDDSVLQDQYKSLKKAFDRTFLISAIILSAFVLWSGTLFNALNGLEAFRFYHLVSGRPFFDYNFVYLIGLIHTLILLVFYIPVRLQFNGLEITQEQKNIDEQGVSDTKKKFKAIWESLGTILLTTSPLIATVLEKLISSFLD